MALKSVHVTKVKRAYDKCLVWFYAFPNLKIGLSDLAKSIRASKTATALVVGTLVKEKFLTKEIFGKSWILSANPRHPYLLTKKGPYHLSKIYESGIVNAVYNMGPQARAIILFGSYRWGTDIDSSDIDIAVEVLDNQELRIVELGIIREFGYRKNVQVNLHIFSRNKIDLNIFANIANGIILDGFLEVRP